MGIIIRRVVAHYCLKRLSTPVVRNSRYLQCAQAPSSPLTGILAQAFAEPSFQSRPVGVGQIEEVITSTEARVHLPGLQWLPYELDYRPTLAAASTMTS